VDTGQQIGSALAGADFGPMSFSPDGTTLATISRDGKVTQWDTSYLTDPRARICAQIGGSLTPADWSQYVPAGLAYRNFCRLVAQGRSCV
jgi:WD40 repeat protein